MKKTEKNHRRQKENISELFAGIATSVILFVCYCFLYDMELAIASDIASLNQNTSKQEEVESISNRTLISNAANLSLSEEEKSWLRDHPIIRVVQDPGWPPIEFADTKGNPSGMTSDYLKLIELRLGVTFERVKNLSWQEAYTKLNHWEIDMTTSVTVTPERTKFWVFTKPYMKIPIVIFAQADVTYIASMHELSGKKIAVVDGYAINEWIPIDFPEINLVKVKDSNEGIALLQKGEVFAYIDNMLVVSYYLAKLKAANVKIAGETPYINAQSMAVRKDWPVFAGILQKALDSISETEQNEIYKKWVPIRYESGFNFRMLWQSLALFIAILLGLVVWNLKLSREIRLRKTAEIALGKSEKRFQQLFRAAAVPLGYVDQEGIIVGINDHFVRIFGYTHKEVPTLNEWYQLAYPDPNYQRWAKETWKASVEIASENNTDIMPIEYQVSCKNGEVRTVLISGNMVDNYLIAAFFDITELKQKEQAIKESEERFRYLSDGSMEAIFFTKKGVCLEANQVAAEIFGYDDRSQFIGMFGTDIIAPESHSIVKRHMLDDIFESYEAIGIRKNGSRFPISIRAKAMPYKDQGIVRVASIADITAIKMAETALLENEKKFRQIYNNILDVYYEASLEGTILEISPSIEKISRYKREELIGKSLYDLYTNPLDRDKLIGIIITQGRVSDYEISLNDKDEEQHICSMNIELIKDEQNNPIKIVGIFRDVTNRKKTEQALILERTFIDAIFNSIPGMLYLYDADGKLIRWNKKHELMTGYSSEELSKMTLLDWYNGDEESQAAVIEGIKNTLEKGFGEAEANLQKKDGTIIPTYFTASLLTISGKQYFTGIGIDITDRKRSEEDREKLQVQLNQAQKMESVGRLAGGVAHDFNNMLGVILGRTEIIMDRMDSSQPFFRDLQEIQNAAQRSADLTRQLLAFARKQTISPKIIDLNQTIQNTLLMLQRIIGEDIDLAWLPGKNLQTVNIDPSQIDQILANLCINSRDAIADNGKITIETGMNIFDDVYCDQHPEFIPGEYTMLAVSDNGCGINTETMGKIFEPFFTTKDTGKGTGLGLATVYGIVKQNNGFINIYSEPGQGTTFSIYLPCHAGEPVEVREESLLENPSGRGETILIVEDETAILDLIRTLLERLGYNILAATTPNEAIRIAETHSDRINLLMTDVVMPEMNGRDLAKKLVEFYPNLSILFMSGYTANVIAHQGVLDEGVQFIQKPFSMKDLAIKVREVLDIIK